MLLTEYSIEVQLFFLVIPLNLFMIVSIYIDKSYSMDEI